MGKKKRQPSNAKPTQSFEQMVSDASIAKLKPFIQQQVVQFGNMLAKNTESIFQALYARLETLEDLCFDKFGVTQEDFALLVAATEDKHAGLTESGELVEKGDTVRIQISTKAKDQEEFQGTSRLKIDNVGAGTNLGPDIEEALIGKKIDEEFEIEFGAEKEMVAKIKVNRTARLPKPKTEKEDGQG